MKNILFVCSGNTCRSPMAEMILKNILKSADNTDFKVTSCGLNANVGEPINPYAKAALKGLGIKMTAKKAKQINDKLIENANIVVCMTDSQKEYLAKFDNVFTFNQLTGVGEIIDPYGQSIEFYQICAKQILKGCSNLYFNLINGM